MGWTVALNLLATLFTKWHVLASISFLTPFLFTVIIFACMGWLIEFVLTIKDYLMRIDVCCILPIKLPWIFDSRILPGVCEGFSVLSSCHNMWIVWLCVFFHITLFDLNFSAFVVSCVWSLSLGSLLLLGFGFRLEQNCFYSSSLVSSGSIV